MKIILFLITLLALPLSAMPAGCKQMILVVPKSWNTSRAEMQLYEYRSGKWVVVSKPIKVRLGRKGSAWGRGLHRMPAGVRTKREGDMKSPAGIFKIGGAWGYSPKIKRHPQLPYTRVTSRNLWVEDSKHARYNDHIVLDHEPRTKWEIDQQMKQGDYAHSLKLFIEHNAPPKTVPGAGSAVFFHIWRGGGSKPTAGCTTLAESELKKLIAWIDPSKKPVYILLPETEYKAYAAGKLKL